MHRCKYYHLTDRYLPYSAGVCWGTKEQEPCTCGGDPKKCNYYPEKRKSCDTKVIPKVIAVDFDGTLCSNKYPEIGTANEEIINYLKEQQVNGAKIILWTCRAGLRLGEAIDWCNEKGLYFDAVNKNLPSVIERFGSDTRKIYADEYIDDHMSTIFNLPFYGT